MVTSATDPKISKHDAAQRLADLFQEYGVGRIHSSSPAAAGCIIGMFSQRWPLLRCLAHQLHDAIEAEKPRFEVGKTYNTKGGYIATVTKANADGSVIVRIAHAGGEWYMRPDGTSPIVDNYSLVPGAVGDPEPSAPITEKRLLDSIAKVNARATDTKAELLGKIDRLSGRLDGTDRRLEAIREGLTDAMDRLDRFAIELQGKENARNVERWVNIWSTPDGPRVGPPIYSSRDEADAAARRDSGQRVGCAKLSDGTVI
jgi:hypothetical protein